MHFQGLPSGAMVKNPFTNDYRRSKRPRVWSLGQEEGNSNSLQYACLENSVDRGAWRASPWVCKESDITEHARTPYISKYEVMFLYTLTFWIHLLCIFLSFSPSQWPFLLSPSLDLPFPNFYTWLCTKDCSLFLFISLKIVLIHFIPSYVI